MQKRVLSRVQRFNFLSLFLLLAFFSNQVFSQNLNMVTGIVQTEDGQPVRSATITAKNARLQFSTSTISDEKGTFKFATLPADSGFSFLFSHLGYVSQELTGYTVKQRETITLIVKLKASSLQLQNVVVIGYGTQNKRDITTSIASLKSDQINNFAATGLDKALTGKLAGVQVLQPNGSPGAGISIMVRGKGTVTAGSDPLYVVDGVPLSDNEVNGPGFKVNPLNALNVNDIESVDILKDASAAAIYGSRGSNGVVIITTKRGKKGKPSFNLNSYYGIQSASKKIPMLDAYQYAELIYDAHNNTYFDLLADRGLTGSASDDNATRLNKLGASPTNTSLAYLLPPEIFPYLNRQEGLTNTNWQDEIFRNAPMHSNTISVAGGSDNIKYYASGNYLDQKGIVINSGYKKYSGRVNIDAAYQRLKLGASINVNHAVYNYLPTEGRFNDNNENVISGALAAAPFFPVYNNDGTYNFDQYKWQYSQSNAANPVALAMLKKDKTYEMKLLGNVFAEYEMWKDIKFKTSFGANISNFDRSTYRPSTLPSPTTRLTPSIPTGLYINSQTINWVFENTLSYTKKIGFHSIKPMAGFTAQKERSSASSVSATGYPNDLVQTLNGAANISGFTAAINEWSLLSALCRVQYSFKDRYLASAAIRADGSSRFGPNTKWGYFPSASLGWNVSDEEFMKNSKLISSLKLRTSFGVTGNFAIGNYAYLSLLSPANYVFGSTLHPGLYQSTAGNPDLGWEKTSAVNMGADIGFLNEKLHLTIDIYNNNTRDLLLNVPVPQSSGFAYNLINIGKVNNRGFEVMLSNHHEIGRFTLSNTFNYSINKNKVLDLGGANSIISQAQSAIYFITQVGQPIGNYYTLVKTGVYKDQAEINDPKSPKVPGAKPGDFKYKDIDGNGIIDANDKTITGNYMPKFIYGFSSQLQYGVFDLNVALQGVYGNTIANINQRHMNSTESYANNTTDALNRWRSPSDPGNGIIARANRSQRGLNATISTYHLSSGSYMRIRDITLGVSIPSKNAQKIGINNARFYITAQNPFTFTRYNSFNPEVSIDTNPLTPGIDYGTYPLAKAFFFGVNLNF